MQRLRISLAAWALTLALAASVSAQGLQVNGYGISYPYQPSYLSPTYYGYNYGPRFNTYAPGPPNSGWGYSGSGYHDHGGGQRGYGGYRHFHGHTSW